jgi:hypothetical protein
VTFPKLQSWQEEIINGMAQGHEIKIMMSGRQTGKTTYSQQVQLYKRMMQDIMNRPVEDIVLAERRIHGARYYTAEPVGGNWLEMETWALDTYGNPGEIWPEEEFIWPECPRWMMNDRKFWFREERDRTLFILRWSR